jgi:thiamine pyrophosphate-dependent acetolactate synthase large subunit-like protein
MLDKKDCLRAIARCRTDEIVITTMGVVRPWAEFSSSDLDFASVGSGMGHAADFGLGLALARPDKRVIVLNGDGSMLMSLGTLATVIDSGARNIVIMVVENGTYEVTGNQPIPGAGIVNLTAIAKGSGFRKVYELNEIEELEKSLPIILKEDGPVFVNLKISPENEPPPIRSEKSPAPYITRTIAEDAHRLRDTILKQR